MLRKKQIVDFPNAEINHTNRTDLDLVSGTNTGDQIADNITIEGNGSVLTPFTLVEEYLLKQSIEDTNGLIGFVNARNVTRVYDYTNRTITLTGDLRYYWKGSLKELASPWVSPVHNDTNGNWFLYSSDGTNFNWSNTSWGFTDIMIALVKRTSSVLTTFALNEMHATMDYMSHDILHRTIGTFIVSGGMVTPGSYVYASQIADNMRPLFEAAIIQDEDSLTNIAAITTRNYTHLRIGVGGEAIFTLNNPYPFYAAGTNVGIYLNNATTGAFAATTTNARLYNVYQILMPVTDDSGSQNFRMVFLQPQIAYTTIASAQAEDVRSLIFGDLVNSIPEFVIYTRITYYYLTSNNCYGDVTIVANGISYVLGTKANQISISGINNYSHLNLLDLELAGNGVTYGHINDSSQTIYGSKTFVNGIKSGFVKYIDTFSITSTNQITLNSILDITSGMGLKLKLVGDANYYYFVIKSISGLILTVEGNKSLSGTIEELWFCNQSNVTLSTIALDNLIFSVAASDVQVLYTNIPQEMQSGHIVSIRTWCRTQDTGAVRGKIDVRNTAGNSLYSTDVDGISFNTNTFTSSGVGLNAANTLYNYGEVLRLYMSGLGSNKDTKDAVLHITQLTIL